LPCKPDVTPIGPDESRGGRGRKLLAGPNDEDIPQLRENGYAPEVPRASLEENVRIEQSFANQHLDEHCAWDAFENVITAREIYYELNEILARDLNARKTRLDAVATDGVAARRLALSMPSTCVTIELKTQYHRDPHKRWTVNDLYDIHALALTVPYCNIVLADTAARAGLTRAKLDQRMNTQLPRRPDDLVNILNKLG
jgi:hypothetical protein